MTKKNPVRGAEPMDDYLADNPREKIGNVIGAASAASIGAIPFGLKYSEYKTKKDREERDRKESSKEKAIENQKQYGMKKGGKVKSASARADGCAIRGKTRA